jgi:hypothetical protein
LFFVSRSDLDSAQREFDKFVGNKFERSRAKRGEPAGPATGM